MPWSRVRRLSRDVAASIGVLGLVSLAGRARAVELQPRAGFEFEHFGQEYRLTDDQDTVTAIDDLGVVLGLAVTNDAGARSRMRLDGALTLGRQSNRARVGFRGEHRRGSNVFLLDQEASVRRFREGGDYSLSSDSYTQSARLGWERELAEGTFVRIQEEVELVLYADPDEYNLSSFLHRPGFTIRREIGLGSEVRAGYRLGIRDVPDSSELSSIRHTVELDLGCFVGDALTIDAAHRTDRRIYDEVSTRESSWEHRMDATIDLMPSGRFGARARPEIEAVRYDDSDELEFDFTRVRISAGPTWRPSSDVQLALAPVVERVSSPRAPAEEYGELGVEVGLELHKGPFWIDCTEGIGRRDYAREATEESFDLDASDIAPDQDALYSDMTTNRLTILLAADLSASATLRLFAHWEPENHRLDRDDAESRIVSGGLEFRF